MRCCHEQINERMKFAAIHLYYDRQHVNFYSTTGIAYIVYGLLGFIIWNGFIRLKIYWLYGFNMHYAIVSPLNCVFLLTGINYLYRFSAGEIGKCMV